jgi:hypothetical protein
MKSLIEVTVLKEYFQETLAEYSEEGFEYLSSKNGDSDDTIIVIFRGDIHATPYSSENSKSFLEFEDGSRSPLYIKRERNFWED